MKNIAFLVSGNIRIYEKNLSFLENLKKEFYNYEIIFICSFWQNQKNLDEFNNKCEECKKEHDSVKQNLILTGFKLCKSCRVSKTIFPI